MAKFANKNGKTVTRNLTEVIACVLVERFSAHTTKSHKIKEKWKQTNFRAVKCNGQPI